MTVASKSEAEPVRLLCIGDSLTQSNPGFRQPLYESLRDGGYDVVFVGPKAEKAPDGGSLDHAGHGGFTIGPGKSKADEWTNGKGNIFANVDEYLESKPDVVLLLVGTNDFFNVGDLQPGYDPSAEGPKRLAAVAEKLHASSPDTKILVGSVMPVGWSDDFAKDFNAALPELLDGIPNVAFVDTGKLAGFVPGDWSEDNLHPSQSGYDKLADVWFNTLKEQLPKPQL